MSPDRLPVSVVVLTFNEERNLAGCLRSVVGWAGEIFVVDSGSTDGTQCIARRYGATVLDHPFVDHQQQWTWALAQLPLGFEWVLGLDADQRVTPELEAELAHLFRHDEARVSAADGFYLKRRQVFRGRWIRHGGYYPKYLLKLFRKDKVYFDPSDLLDHHFYVRGHADTLHADIVEDNQNEYDIQFWIDKHNTYAKRHAREELLRRSGQSPWPLPPRFFGTPDQRVIWLKQRWYSLPLYVRPALYFAYRYVARRGFLDGKEGFIFHFLQAFWYRLLIDIHLEQQLQQQSGSVGAGSSDRAAQGRTSSTDVGDSYARTRN
jgi:glycosyltransferase involved in cell wall biosynthesis